MKIKGNKNISHRLSIDGSKITIFKNIISIKLHKIQRIFNLQKIIK